MLDYVKNTLRKLKYKPSKKTQYSFHAYSPVDYEKHDTTQYATAPDKSPTLTTKEIKYIQSVVGTFLYYARALDGTIISALDDISSQQAISTVNIIKKVKYY